MADEMNSDNMSDNIGNDTQPSTPGAAVDQRFKLVELVFQSCVITIGMIGSLANGMVITTIGVVHYKKKKMATSTKFIFNQLALDLFSCLSLVLDNSWKIANMELLSQWNFMSCAFVASDALTWTGVNGSLINLIVVTLERYVKIVHNSSYQRYYRNWITYVLIILAWIIGVLINIPADFMTIDFSNGICNPYSKWPSSQASTMYTVGLFILNYTIPMLVFIVCYARILTFMRTSAGFFSNSTNLTNPSLTNMHLKSQVTLIKTMVLITVVFGLLWSPNDILTVLVYLNIPSLQDQFVWTIAWNTTLFLGFLTACIHPFIYGARIGDVKKLFKTSAGQRMKSGGNSTADPETFNSRF